jgi:flagellar hook assembly protein FlgD
MKNQNVEIAPIKYSLSQNHPNPFNPITSLRYDLPNDGLVNITIYNMMGRIVKTLVNGSQTAGHKSIQWNATDDRNEPVSAGLYLYTIQAGEFRQTRKMVLLK